MSVSQSVWELVKDRENICFSFVSPVPGPGPECAHGSLFDKLINWLDGSFTYSVWQQWGRWYCEFHHFLANLPERFFGFTSSKVSSVLEKPSKTNLQSPVILLRPPWSNTLEGSWTGVGHFRKQVSLTDLLHQHFNNASVICLHSQLCKSCIGGLLWGGRRKSCRK